jgi:hypothetical protein
MIYKRCYRYPETQFWLFYELESTMKRWKQHEMENWWYNEQDYKRTPLTKWIKTYPNYCPCCITRFKTGHENCQHCVYLEDL